MLNCNGYFVDFPLPEVKQEGKGTASTSPKLNGIWITKPARRWIVQNSAACKKTSSMVV
jgi:hypothetical protein